MLRRELTGAFRSAFESRLAQLLEFMQSTTGGGKEISNPERNQDFLIFWVDATFLVWPLCCIQEARRFTLASILSYALGMRKTVVWHA